MAKMKTLMAVAGAASLMVTPMVASAANPASALSVRNVAAQGTAVRAGTPMKKSSGIGAAIYPIIIIAIVGATLGFAIDDDGSDPDSN